MNFLLRVTFPLVMVVLVVSNPCLGQDKIPESEAGKRLVQLLEVLNQREAEKRDQLIDGIFDDQDGDLADIKATAGRIGKQLGGVKFSKVFRTNDRECFAVCDTEKGMTIVVGVSIGGTENLIVDVTIRPHEEETKELEAVGDFIPLISSGTSNPRFRGVWQAKGYGYVLEVTETELKAYNFTGKFGWEMDFEENMLAKPGPDKDHAVVTFHPLEPGYHLTRLESLPSVCGKTEWNSAEVFDAFVDVMNAHYPFFEVRGVDWKKRTATHRPKVSSEMSEGELFDVCDSMLSELNDGHVSLTAEIDGKPRRANVGRKGSTKRLFEAFENQTKYKSRGVFINLFRDRLIEHVSTEVLGGKVKKACNDRLIWGRVNDEIGYLYVAGMYGYGSGEMSEQVASLHAGMNQVLKDLSDTKAIIIDLSMNPGGTDAISVEIARHFADKERLGFSKWPASHPEYKNERLVSPYQGENQSEAVVYTKPVFLLTSEFTASAAEIFTMCMRAMPQVTTVGEPTSGALSDILNKTLPNGWEFGISNEVYVDHAGVSHEGPGIPPEFRFAVFQDDIMKIDHKATLGRVVEVISQKLGQ